MLTPFTFICKNTQVPETNEIRRSHFWEFKSLSDLSSAQSYVYCYRGIVGDGAFMDTNAGKTHKKNIISSSSSFFLILHLELYSQLCTIEVDLSHLWNTSNVQTKSKLSSSEVYYTVLYDLIMLFGGTEIEAQVCWKENVRSTIFENCLLCWELTTPTTFSYLLFRVSRRGKWFFSSLSDWHFNYIGWFYVGAPLK